MVDRFSLRKWASGHQVRTIFVSVWQFLSQPSVLAIIIFLFLCFMFPLAYTESLRWPFPGPKATHGILKGLFLLLSGLLIVFRRRLWPQKSPGQNIVMVIFLLAYVLSAAFSHAPDSSLLNLWYPFIACSILFGLSRIRLSKIQLTIFLALAALLVFVTFTFSFFSLMFRYSVDNIYYFIFLDHRANQLLSELRTFGKYVSLGPYLFLTPMLASFLVEKKAGIARKLLSVLIIFVSILTAVISNNRIDVLIIAIQMVVLLAVLPRRLAVIILLVSIPIVGFGLATTEKFFGFSLEDRILRPKVERDQETVGIRFTYWQTALYNFQNSPLFGTGPNTYNDVSVFPIRRYYSQGSREYFYRTDEGIGVHNIFFERLSDTGIVGFFSFVLLLFYFLRSDFLRLLKPESSEQKRIFILYSLSSWSWILYGLTDNGYGAQGFVIFFFIRGLLLHV